jgi:hypothetical protein
MSDSQPSRSGDAPERAHRRQAFWQIYVPAFLGAAAFIALCVWVVLYTIGYVPQTGLADQQSPPAKIAVIWILLPTCFGSLIPIGILGGLVYLSGRGIRGLPKAAHKAQSAAWRMSDMAKSASDKIAQPVISVDSAKAGVDRIWHRLAFWKRSA